MFDVRSWSHRVKERRDSEGEPDTESEIAEFLATATLDEGKAPKRWSTIPKSQARGATSRVSHNPPPTHVDQTTDTHIHLTGSPSDPLVSLPSPSQAPVRRCAEAPRHHDFQPLNNLSEVEQSPTEPDDILLGGRTYRFPFSTDEFVLRHRVEVEGDRPNSSRVEPYGTTNLSLNPEASHTHHPYPTELSADTAPAGESISEADIPVHPRAGSGLNGNVISRAITSLAEQPNNMNPSSTGGPVHDNESSWSSQGHKLISPVLHTQVSHHPNDHRFDPAQLEEYVDNGQDRELATVSVAGPEFIPHSLQDDGDCGSPGPSMTSHHHDDRMVLNKFDGQSVSPSVNSRGHDKHTSPPPPRGHDTAGPPVHQNRQPFSDSFHGRRTTNARDDNARYQSLQPAEWSSSTPPQGINHYQDAYGVDLSSRLDMNHMPVTQWSSEASLFPQGPRLEPVIAQTSPEAGNPPQRAKDLPGSGQPSKNDMSHQAYAIPQTENPATNSWHDSARHPGEPAHLAVPKISKASGAKQSQHTLTKRKVASNHGPKDGPEGAKNWRGVMKKVTNLVGGSGNPMPVSYSPEEITRRCVDFMEQHKIRSNAGLDPFSTILVYAQRKWSGDEAHIQAQGIEIQKLGERKEKFKCQLESTQKELQSVILRRDELQRTLIATEGRLKATEKELKGKQDLLRKEAREKDDLKKWAQELEATNEEVFTEGQMRIHKLNETISDTIRTKDIEFRKMVISKDDEYRRMTRIKDDKFDKLKLACDTEIIRLQTVIASIGAKRFRDVSDDNFKRMMQAAAQTINNLVDYIPRPASESLEADLDVTSFLRRNEPYLGNRVWAKFIFTVCWGVLKRGFFGAPLGFGILGVEGDGCATLLHLRETLGIYDPTTNTLEIPNNKETNEVRAFLFERLRADVVASATTQPADSANGEKGAKGLPAYFYKHVETVMNELLSVLSRCSAGNLNPLAPSLIQDLVRDVGLLALEMATQRAHVTLEFCIHGDVIQHGKYFTDEASGEGAAGPARVDLMIEPALTRMGNGRDKLTELDVVRKGSFVALRG